MNENNMFVVAGSLCDSLVTSKVLPIVKAKQIHKVYVFKDHPGVSIDHVEYIVLPHMARGSAVLRNLIRMIQVVYWAIRLKPKYINGVYTLPNGFFSLLASRVAGSRCIVSVIGGPVEIETYYYPKAFWKWLNMRLLKACAAVTTKGNAVLEYLVENGAVRDRVHVYNGGIDTERYCERKGIQRNIDMLFVGRLTELKGPDRFIDVVSLVKSEMPQVTAAILGTGPLADSVLKRISKNHLTKSIVWAGSVQDTEAWYQRSKLIIMPSRSEGLSTAMLEAMSCGCVPIVSNVGNMSEAALHGINARTVDIYTDIRTFAAHAKDLLQDQALRDQYAKKSRDLVEERYGVAIQSQQIARILSQCG